MEWLSRDPIAERGGLNLYGYVGNDPVSSALLKGFMDHLLGRLAPFCRIDCLLPLSMAKLELPEYFLFGNGSAG